MEAGRGPDRTGHLADPFDETSGPGPVFRPASPPGTTEDAIRGAGFDVMPDPTRRFPNHHRIIHPEGAAGFTDENLARLSEAFTDTVLEE